MEAIKSQSKLAVEDVLGMNGGDGEYSYAKNSSVQLHGIEATKPYLDRAICDHVTLMTNVGGTFRIADFGCGTGKNTLLVADSVVSAVQRSLHHEEEEEEEMPEFEVYFVDLPSNDFNSLFRILPPLREEGSAVVDKNTLSGRSYTAAAVCGSHFRRLLPRKSLHFCHSSASLHWLSQVPETVRERRSPHVYITSDCEEDVAAAYLDQFKTDFTSFLKARAEEMVDGGGMFICLPGRKEGSNILDEQGVCGFVARQIDSAFEELVNEGMVEKEKWESFKMPVFSPNLEELESIVKSEGSFGEELLKTIQGINGYSMLHGEEDTFGRLVANNCRAAFENIIEDHLGCKTLSTELFSRIGKSATILVEEYLSLETSLLVAFLRKKGAYNKTYQ